jgi:hypothetical protein
MVVNWDERMFFTALLDDAQTGRNDAVKITGFYSCNNIRGFVLLFLNISTLKIPGAVVPEEFAII